MNEFPNFSLLDDRVESGRKVRNVIGRDFSLPRSFLRDEDTPLRVLSTTNGAIPLHRAGSIPGTVQKLGVSSSGSYNRGSPPGKGRSMAAPERRRRLKKLIAWGSLLVAPSFSEAGKGGLGGYAFGSFAYVSALNAGGEPQTCGSWVVQTKLGLQAKLREDSERTRQHSVALNPTLKRTRATQVNL